MDYMPKIRVSKIRVSKPSNLYMSKIGFVGVSTNLLICVGANNVFNSTNLVGCQVIKTFSMMINFKHRMDF